MEYILKIVSVFIVASLKYFWASPYSFGLKLNEWETLFIMEMGGILGFMFYYYSFGFSVFEVVDVIVSVEFIESKVIILVFISFGGISSISIFCISSISIF